MYLYKRYKSGEKTTTKNTSRCVHTCAAEAFTIRMTGGGLSTVRAVTVNNISPEFHCLEQIYTRSLHVDVTCMKN